MKYQESIILLPCHSLEDFPLHHEGEEAQGLLAGWSALWHPAIIASTESTPLWLRVDEPPDQLAHRLIVVPSVSLGELPTGFADRAAKQGACFISQKIDRNEILSLALEHLDGGDQGVDRSLAADFLALGYCYLQIQLLTRQMRYGSSLDEVLFNDQTVAAAQAAVRGERDAACEKVAACFDMLSEERDHYYPVDSYLIDLTLVAPTTLGSALRRELALPTPINLLLSAGVLKVMAQREPESLEALRSALHSGRAALIGGELVERRLPLLSCESILGELLRGQAEYEKRLGHRPTVFGRRRFGLTPTLPQILHKLGFQGALHATLDDGRFPEGAQIKTRWEGSDGAAIDAVARAPLDATKPETYLNLGVKMGESMDMDHVATVCLAHWPGPASPWLDDLRRIGSYCAALGKFITIDDYFRETDDPGQTDRFGADRYHSPYLKQAVLCRQADPVSAAAGYWRRRAWAEAVQTLDCLACLVTGEVPRSSHDLLTRIEQLGEQPASASLERELTEAVARATERFAASLPRQRVEAQLGYLVANPCSFTRRVAVETPQLERLPEVRPPVYAAGQSHDRKHVVVDVPPMGFVWITSGGGQAAKRRGALKTLAEDCSAQEGYYALQNEYFQVLIDATTGALRSLYEYRSRGNRLSQQLAYRLPGEARRAPKARPPRAVYSVMAADSIQVTANDPAVGEIVVRGRLLDRSGTALADYRQTFRLGRGSRVLLLDIELEPHVEPEADPWDSYFAARFAWADETADLWRSVNQSRQPIGGKRFEAPQYIEIESAGGQQRITILTGGVPFHRRQGFRMLDSLLIVRGESARRFQLGIGVDLTHSLQQAIGLLAPPTVVAQCAAPPGPTGTGWLFHLDAKNVVATHWEPLVCEGTVRGFRVRLLESAGRPARATLSSFRKIGAARQVDFQGNPLGDCKVDAGKVRLDLSAAEWIEVECQWQEGS